MCDGSYPCCVHTDVLRLTAFAADPSGGNPAGVVLDAAALTDSEMQQIAARVGYAETAFVTRPPEPGLDGSARVGIRYFSPAAEVPFCGHATIATAVALAWRDGVGATVFETRAGELEVRTSEHDGRVAAAFTSVEPRVAELPDDVLDGLLRIVGLTRADLHPGYPPRSAFAGNVHPIVVLTDVAALDRVAFDAAELRAYMDAHGWVATVTLVHPRDSGTYEVRNPFPVGTLDEDPATGSAAAALGGYLRELRLVDPPARVLVHQGRHVGRPSLLTVDVPPTGGIVVSGTAFRIQD